MVIQSPHFTINSADKRKKPYQMTRQTCARRKHFEWQQDQSEKYIVFVVINKFKQTTVQFLLLDH